MILGILQARYSSTRLPGKVLKPIVGTPMLFHQIERVRRASLLDGLIVATSADSSDDQLTIALHNRGIKCFRGSLDDVLDRFYQAASQSSPAHVVRLTGDCPLSDPDIIHDVIRFHLEGGYDYSSNTIKPTFPDGLDVEIVRFTSLKQGWQKAKLKSEREHVTPYFYNNPDKFKIGSFTQSPDLSQLRWTVDNLQDFELIHEIYSSLYPVNSAFTTQDILSLLDERPELKTINTKSNRNEGYEKSLTEDSLI
ncbi:MAG: glycosyltransferase family protein [candidate division Zixibacteria bacterium]|nr:glycosyltransferase family protein [candidate division Zixibacteria bacterium]